MNHLTKVIIVGFLSSSLFFLAYNSGYAGDEVKGKEVYERLCEICHGTEGHPQVSTVPNFSKGETLNKGEEELIKSTKKGHKSDGSAPPMPSLKGHFSDDELEDAISYIFSLKK